MWQTNLKIALVVLGTLGLYTLVANAIPQVASEVPEELSFSGEVDIAQLVTAGEGLYGGAGGCTACHGTGARAPNLVTDFEGEGAIGQRCGERVPNMDCKTYLYESMVDPNSYVVAGFAPIMPDSRRTLSETQIWALVAYMETQGGQVTVTSEDVQRTAGGEAAPAGGDADGGGAAAGPVGAPGGTDPMALLQANTCLGCHTMGDLGANLGPSFDGMGARASEEQIRRGIIDPGVEAAAGYEALLGMMPTHYGDQFSAVQVEVLVQFLTSRR